jgi:LCP family protein required for cell wall assembly
MARHKHLRVTTRRKIGRALAVVTAVLMVLVSVGGYLTYRHLDGNITALDTSAALGDDRPTAATSTKNTKPLNILLLGSDSRAGQTEIKGSTPGLSDTTILLHINASRTALTGVSIPRDSMVQRPYCLSKDGHTTVRGELAMFNTAYAVGGPGCAQRTVEQLTNIRTDHFAVVDFAGFENMVDALDGVPICVPQEVNDDIGKIYLPAGSYNADGKQALGYVRERHEMSANGDLGRMKRQQTFLAAMANKALSTGTLTDPTRLYRFLDAATQSLTTDPDLASVASLASLATELRGVKEKNIRFLSIPTVPYPADPNRLAWAPQARAVWAALRNDAPLPKTVRSDTTSATASASSTNKTSETGSVPSPAPTPHNDHKVREADSNGLCL